MDPVKLERLLVVTLITTALAGCAIAPPSLPTVMALPARGKSINEFQQDDYSCRTYASGIVNPIASSHQGAGSALAAPAVGAAAGALIGAGTGSAGAGAVIGAGTGLLFGSAIGSGQQHQTEASLQQQFDNAYAQCITAKGNTIETLRPATVMVPAPAVIYAPQPYCYVPY
jgi:hypothetical protein